MDDSWATFGSDLQMRVDRHRVRVSLEASLREAISSSRLPPGTVLPSSRALAADLHVARNTVAEVYGELVAEGWLRARAGSRTVVAELPARDRPLPLPVPAAVRQYPDVQPLDLRPGWPDLSAFPRQEWLRAAARAITDAPVDAFGYQEPRGRPELRTALAGYLGRTRGLTVSPDQILVCLGITQGLGLIARALRRRGAAEIAVESHGLWVHHEVLGNCGLELRPLRVDDEGARFDGGVDDTDAVLLTPGHQFPFGVTLSQRRREWIVSWARRRNRFIIEDDYEGEFNDAPDGPAALQRLAPDHVVYAGTASKTLGPGLRLGWLVLPPDLLDDVTAIRGLADGHNSVLDQLTLAQLIDSGRYDRHVRAVRRKYQHRRRQLETAVPEHLRRTPGTGSSGLHAIVDLPPGLTEARMVAEGRALGLTVEGLDTYRVPSAPPAPPALVIGYANPAERRYPECLALLSRLLQPTKEGRRTASSDGRRETTG